MTTINEIRYSQLEGRLDSEYYKPEYLEVYNKLKKKETIPLKDVAKEIVSGSYINTYFPKGVLYLRVNNLRENGFNFSDVKYVNIGYSTIPQRIMVHTNDLILSRTGTIGISLIVPNELNGVVMSQHITKIIAREGINRYYLMVYLNSKYGRLQAEKTALGSMQKELTLNATKNIKIFLPSKLFQEKIEKLVKEAFSKRKLADQKYKQAKQLLEEELGLDKLRLKEEKTFEAKFSDIDGSTRFDSEYYKPKYKQIIEFLKNSGFEVKKLKEAVNISDKKIAPTKEPNKKYRYVPIAKINQNGEIDEWDEFSGWQAPSRARMLILKGDVLVSSLGGSIDKIALIPEEADNLLATTGTFVINSDNFYSEFLFLLFRTELIKLQLEQKTAGAIMTAVPKTTFGDLLIPLIPKSNQEQISTLVRESFSLRKESKNLLEESKKVVERAIENGT